MSVNQLFWSLLFLLTAPFFAQADPVNLIAYVGTDQNIYTTKPDGTDRQNLTQAEPAQITLRVQFSTPRDRRLFNWPTWSPSGTHILCHGARLSEGGATLGVYLLSVKSPHLVKTLYESEKEQPIYAYWAPDEKRAADILGSEETIALTLVATEEHTPPATLRQGAPFYFDWGKNSNSLLIHVGGSARLSPSAMVSLLSVTDKEVKILSSSPAEFRAPSWSPDGRWLAFAAFADGKSSLFLSPATGEEPRPLYPAAENAAFSWSPRSTQIALTSSPSPSDLLFQGLTAISVPPGKPTSLTKDPIGAFFWSPTGEKILYTSPNPREGTWSWHVVDADGRHNRKVADFLPSNTLLRLFAYFDQYALSHRLWSPDGRHFVYAGFPLPEQSQRQPSPRLPQIFVADVEGDHSPHPIAEGSIAFWSFQ